MSSILQAAIGPELGHDPIRHLETPIDAVRPSPENEKLYAPVRSDDPEIIALANSIRERGILEPLVITADHWVLSGHRRHVAAKLAGLVSVPCRVDPISRECDPDAFLAKLREFNRQREKSFDEKLREEIVTINPEAAYHSLVEYRKEQAGVRVKSLDMGVAKGRARISDAKQPFLSAIQRVLQENAEFLPLSDRQVHYRLLNDPPLRHASKPGSRYGNDFASYKSLVDLLTRARLEGAIPLDAIADETRPVTTWQVWPDVRGFVRSELEDLLRGYWRDLMRSQPHHIEILVEKNTVYKLVKDVAMQYCIPTTSGRGFCSLPPRSGMAKRFRASGKEKLVVLILSDFDPDGEEIAASFARSMRADFHIEAIVPVKVALTRPQVRQFRLQPRMIAKETSTNYAKFVRAHGTNVFELEALAPKQLQEIVRKAIDQVIDAELFNRELEQEKQDAAEIEALRRRVVEAVQRRTAA